MFGVGVLGNGTWCQELGIWQGEIVRVVRMVIQGIAGYWEGCGVISRVEVIVQKIPGGIRVKEKVLIAGSGKKGR